MDRWTEIELFVQVAEIGSLSRAAEALDLSNAAASRHLSALEERLGARLVERNTRRLYLTDTGREFFSRARTILADLKDAEERLASATTQLAQAQKDLAEAQQKAEQIRADGKARAEAIRLDSEKRTIDEMARLKQGAAADMDAEAARVSNQLRREAARLAIEKALATLPGKLSPEAQSQLVSQSINTLGNA